MGLGFVTKDGVALGALLVSTYILAKSSVSSLENCNWISNFNQKGFLYVLRKQYQIRIIGFNITLKQMLIEQNSHIQVSIIW